MGQKTSPYKGILRKPMVFSKGMLPKDLVEPTKKRLVALCEHFEISFEFPNRTKPWADLAMALAERYVSGFGIRLAGASKRGRPKLWDEETISRLFAEVETGVAKGKSISQACRDLTLPGRGYTNVSKGTLERIYRASKSGKTAYPLKHGRNPEEISGLISVCKKFATYDDRLVAISKHSGKSPHD